MATGAEVDAAVQCAASAFRLWADVPPPRRARVMFRFQELLNQNAKRIARALSEEHGKTLPDAEAEVARRHRSGGVCLRSTSTPERRIQRQRRHGRRQLLPTPAAGSGCRHYAVQFSGDGADVDVPARPCLRKRLRIEALRA